MPTTMKRREMRYNILEPDPTASSWDDILHQIYLPPPSASFRLLHLKLHEERETDVVVLFHFLVPPVVPSELRG